MKIIHDGLMTLALKSFYLIPFSMLNFWPTNFATFMIQNWKFRRGDDKIRRGSKVSNFRRFFTFGVDFVCTSVWPSNFSFKTCYIRRKVANASNGLVFWDVTSRRARTLQIHFRRSLFWLWGQKTNTFWHLLFEPYGSMNSRSYPCLSHFLRIQIWIKTKIWFAQGILTSKVVFNSCDEEQTC